MKTKAIALRYFTDHPDKIDDVMKAYFAFHASNIHEPGAHNFTNGARQCKCVWCGRSREMVRYDDEPARCMKKPSASHPSDIILNEENAAFALIERAQKIVPDIISKRGMNGATLAFLHYTHGFDPETVAGVTPVPESIIEQYEQEMETEREKSRASQKKVVVCAASKNTNLQ